MRGRLFDFATAIFALAAAITREDVGQREYDPNRDL